MIAPINVAAAHVEGDGANPRVRVPRLAGLGVQAVPEAAEGNLRGRPPAIAVCGPTLLSLAINTLCDGVRLGHVTKPLHPNLGHGQRQARTPALHVNAGWHRRQELPARVSGPS